MNVYDGRRIYLRCPDCGYATKGLVVDGKPPRYVHVGFIQKESAKQAA